jgi:Trk K+ transport system NAD-binding subunit
MGGYYFLLPTLVVIFISYLIVRAGGVALMMTGMDWERARFQSLSAFTGTGFTTREAEIVLKHPTRRKIVSWLMILGNAGIVTVIVTATSSLVSNRGYQISLDFFLLVAGTYLIYRLAKNKGLTVRWENFVKRRLLNMPDFEEGTTEDLLHFLEGYGLVRLRIRESSPLANKKLLELRLKQKGIIILGIEREGKWIQSPDGNDSLFPKDKIVIYGPLKLLSKF